MNSLLNINDHASREFTKFCDGFEGISEELLPDDDLLIREFLAGISRKRVALSESVISEITT